VATQRTRGRAGGATAQRSLERQFPQVVAREIALAGGRGRMAHGYVLSSSVGAYEVS
jgi:hypothetical protein